MCRDRAPKVLTSAPEMPASDNDHEGLGLNPEAQGRELTDDMLPCPGCGWQPEVIVLHVIVVDAAEELSRESSSPLEPPGT
jgi:hypothetical protein